MEGKRPKKVADLLQKEISGLLVKTIKDPRIGFVTVTRVQVTEDCRAARIYYSLMGTSEEREECLKGLNSAKGYIRKELGRRMKLKYTPELLFQFDPSIEYGIHMEDLIHRLQEEREKRKRNDKDGRISGCGQT